MSGSLDPRYARPLDETRGPQETKATPPRKGWLARLISSLVHTRIDKSTWRIRLVAIGFAALFFCVNEWLGVKRWCMCCLKHDIVD
jgi:hypothetical protein